MHDYYRRKAEEVILELIKGIEKGATLNWVPGCLREMLEHNKLLLFPLPLYVEYDSYHYGILCSTSSISTVSLLDCSSAIA